MYKNLLGETTRQLSAHNYHHSDVYFISDGKHYTFDWHVFANHAKDVYYDSGYGVEEINTQLKLVMRDGSWFSRASYDGSEWWDYHRAPQPEGELTDVLILKEDN